MQNLDRSTVHVVDHHAFVRKFLSGLIESSGFEVESFSEAAEYLEYVNSDKFVFPVATFVDVSSPDMNGPEMMRDTQLIKSDLRFVIMGGEMDIRSGYKHLACMYLRKPLNPTSVAETLNKLTKCKTCGASTTIGCKSSESEGFYQVTGWICPDIMLTSSE